MKKERKVLIATTEAVPFAKTGGLADVTGSLPGALKNMGADVNLVMPKYSFIDDKKFKIKDTGFSFNVPMDGHDVEVKISKTTLPGTKNDVFFVECDRYFDRDGLYGEGGCDYTDNDMRFALFSRAVVDMMKVMDFKPEVVHCNDWQTGLIPTYMRTVYGNDDFYRGISTIMTIHNIAFQGVFPAETMNRIGLPWDIFNVDGVEYWGQVSYLKSGIVYADLISTVSETYAREIQTSHEFGLGMEGLLASRSDDLYGIINGIDYSTWNPSKDKHLNSTYDNSDLRGKNRNKKDLQKTRGLDTGNIPMITMVTRLDENKGIEMVAQAMEQIMNMDVQMMILASGEKRYEDMLQQLADTYRNNLSVEISFDETMAHKIYAGGDIFLMPSKTEPCGTSQMIALHYGQLPIVHNTGGLADTVTDYTDNPDTGNGFTFDEFTTGAMMDAIDRALETYSNKRKWNSIVKKSMAVDYSWKNSASKYMDLYKKAAEKKEAVLA
ncbi:MAG: glycogen synthase GlgA [Vulcanimicrobiota bacterium]